MKSLRAPAPLLVIAIAGSLQAQKTDWQAIKNLPEETPIVVNLQHKRGFSECWFEKATDGDLTCNRDNQDPASVIYRRDEIRKIYRKPLFGRPGSPWFATPLEFAGGVAGIFVGLRLGHYQSASAALPGAIGGALVPALIVAHFNHGKLIYRSP